MSKMSYENKKIYGGRFKIFINIIILLLLAYWQGIISSCVFDVGSRQQNLFFVVSGQVRIHAKNTIVNEPSR